MEDDDAAAGKADEASSGATATLDRAAGGISGLKRSLTVQPEDSTLVGAAKITGAALIILLIFVISPLIIFGLVTGLAVAA